MTRIFLLTLISISLFCKPAPAQPFAAPAVRNATSAVSAAPPAVRHVVLITIDGFRPDFYLDAGWDAVNLRQMMNEGVYAKGVNSVVPTVTYPSHTTIITGVPPAMHGIYYNAPFEPEGATGKWYWEYSAIRSPTLWDALHKAGMTTANVIWPVTVGAPIDYNIPDIWPLGKDKDRRALTRRYATPAGLLEEVEQKATGQLEAADFSMDEDYLVMDENTARMGAYLIRTYKPALTTIHLACVDHYEHQQGRDGDKVRRAVAGADRAVRTIIEAISRAGIKDSTAVIVTGDHGFVDIHNSLAPNVWLTKAGLMGDVKKGEWKAQFHQSGGSAFLMLKDSQDLATLGEVKQILANLPADEKKLFRVVDKRELESMGADPHAALALAAIPGITFSGAFKGAVVKPVQGGTHGYFPDFYEIRTGFIGYGAGFSKGKVISKMGLEDIAPVVAQLLGVDFPSATGHVVPGMLKE